MLLATTPDGPDGIVEVVPFPADGALVFVGGQDVLVEGEVGAQQIIEEGGEPRLVAHDRIPGGTALSMLMQIAPTSP